MSAAARWCGAGLAIALLALVTSACGTAPATVPAPQYPMMSGTAVPPSGNDDGYGMPGGMMGGRPPSTAAAPHTGEVAGEGLDPAAIATVQTAVDRGAQPWRLDPQLTALAFARGHLGWMMPHAQDGEPGAVVVDDGPGGAIVLHLTQPGRTGTTGIWTVTGGTWVR